MGLWANVNHNIIEKRKDAGFYCFVLPVTSQGSGVGNVIGKAVTVPTASHGEAESQQASSTWGLEKIQSVTLSSTVSSP